MQERMNHLVQDAQSVQRQLGQLSELMTKFSVEIVKQKEEMCRIVDVVQQSNINIEKGNDQLIEATSTSADFRFFVLLFLIVMSATLLFLHWYN